MRTQGSGRREHYPSRSCPGRDAQCPDPWFLTFPIKGNFREASDGRHTVKATRARVAFLLQGVEGVDCPSFRMDRFAGQLHQKTCQAPASGRTIVFAYRAADATPVIREARCDSRESGITPGRWISIVACAVRGENSGLRRLNRHRTATPVRSMDRRGSRSCSPALLRSQSSGSRWGPGTQSTSLRRCINFPAVSVHSHCGSQAGTQPMIRCS